jgi:hypothetical protein
MAKNREQRRAVSQLQRKDAGVGVVRIVEDPITVGLDRSINIDLSKLEAPTNLYDADIAWIKHEIGRVSLFFAKRSVSTTGELRTRLELRYPPENLVHHFWRNSRDFHAGLRQFVERWPKDVQGPAVDANSIAAQRDHSEWVNFEAMSHAGTEATIDFYQLPPPGIARFAQGLGSSQLKIVPIVRVQMTTFELVHLLDAAATVVAEVERYLPPLVGR